MKNNYKKQIKELKKNKIETIQKLISRPYGELEELETIYFDLLMEAKNTGKMESEEIDSLKYYVICEAIEIKKGNEEQAWDYLT